MNSTMHEILLFMRNYSESNVGPVMFLYTEWILKEAQKRGLKRLYFLARDGFLLCEIAKKITSCRGLDVECRYLYCSRQALRVPSYHIIGDEAFELLTLGGFYLTPRSVVSRAAIGKNGEDKVLEQLGVSEPDKPLIENEFLDFRERLKKNDFFRQLVTQTSLSSYGDTIEYFKQEGLFDNDYVAIVDSGWTGSMQRSLRQLLESAGYHGQLYGFYFGMYQNREDPDDGTYLNFYFDHESGFFRKLNFNNNLFECMLSATDPMTVGYEKRDGAFHPIFTKGHSAKLIPLIEMQIEGALNYTDRVLQGSDGIMFDAKKAKRKCYKILKRAMVYPTKKEVELLSNFMFCDDVTEIHRNPLADSEMTRKLSNYNFIPRMWKKLTGNKNNDACDILWIYGVIALCPKIARPWYRLNVKLWESIKLLLKK